MFLVIGMLSKEDSMDHESIQAAVGQILASIGEDPHRLGLRGTPERVSRMYAELLSGYNADPQAIINEAIYEQDYNEMVLVRGIEFASMCEHHLLPFIGHAHVAYVPRGRVIGLSKVPRIVDVFARRLQIQEQMTRQIADFLMEVLQPHGVGVVVEALHLCASVRGVRKADARMVTSAMCGNFKSDQRTRAEFLEHLNRQLERVM
jgi:GTP cyclohydrolase IA